MWLALLEIIFGVAPAGVEGHAASCQVDTCVIVTLLGIVAQW